MSGISAKSEISFFCSWVQMSNGMLVTFYYYFMTNSLLRCYSNKKHTHTHNSVVLVHVSFRRLWVRRQASGVPQCSDVYFQWRQSVPARTAATVTRRNLRRTAQWTPELRPRRRSQTPDSPSACSQRRRGRGCAYEEGGRVHNKSPITREGGGGRGETTTTNRGDNAGTYTKVTAFLPPTHFLLMKIKMPMTAHTRHRLPTRQVTMSDGSTGIDTSSPQRSPW